MGELEPRWSRRHKRRARRIGYDVRLFAPLVAIAVCLAGSATAILAAERVAPSGLQKAGIDALGPIPAEDCRPVE
ncbi:MAG: hypothetical protein NXI30_01220 [bacterium]|nr:hypothetical protein [bacterium]